VDFISRNGACSAQCESTSEYRETAKDLLLSLAEQSMAPIERGGH
jgi:hypothetical protein